MRVRRLQRIKAAVILGALLLSMAGCQQYWRDSGLWDIDGHKGLLLDISNYYHRHATEEGGRCRSPIIDGLTRAEIVEENEEKLWVALRYYYRDFVNDDDCDRRSRSLRCTFHRECRGFASRTFEAVKAEGSSYDITEMTGGRRR